MTKLKLHTPDLTAANVERIASLFPNCITEATDETGKLKRAIDFDLLKQELYADLVEGPQERYRLDWPGKREALALANTPVALTLRPCREESVDFEHTKNLYIEGDNLDALKLLQETYLGKVKMIYIDPPYNTGNDFIYDDNFSMSREDYERRSGDVDEEGNVMFDEEKWRQNSSSNGRFHSEWLSMIYPRLKLARNLLREDGVIFISIDQGESHNLKKICDEIFGTEQFISELIWVKANKPLNTARSGFSRNTESILTYSRQGELAVEPLPLTDKHASTYRNPDDDPRGDWTKVPLFLRTNSNKPKALLTPWDGEKRTEKWFCAQATLDELWNSNRIIVTEKQVYKKIFLSDSGGRRPLNILDSELTGFSRNGTEEVRSLGIEMDFPKPTQLLRFLLSRVSQTSTEDVILDFFSGSATTAHAVMQLNAEDGGKRRHIMVQLPEPCDEKSEAFKAGFKTIAEIGKERIRRAGKKILSEWQAKQAKEKPAQGDLLYPQSTISDPPSPPDIGFRVLKIDSSNFADIHRTPDELNQKELALHTEHIKPERTSEDLLFQVLVDWGVDLALPVTEEVIDGKQVFFVDGNALAACFDTGLTDGLIKVIAARKPMRAVFRDESYGDDSTRINVEQIFKLLSPATEVKSL